MKISPIKPYYINFCAKNKHNKKNTKPENIFDDLNSTPARLLYSEEPDVIDKYIKLKNSHFSRKLTDEEAWVLARPWSISYGDFCERFEDNGHSNLYMLEDVTRAEINARKKFKTRFFNDTEIQAFITLKDETDFISASQIMRYIRLMAKDNGLIISPTPLEAEYFAKKCTPYDEIEKYFQDKKNSPQHIAISKKYPIFKFSLRQNQIDNSKATFLQSARGNEKRYFTFVNGELKNKSKSTLDKNIATNYDSAQKTTIIRTLGSIIHKNEPALFTKDIIEILNNEHGEPNRIIKTYFDEDFIAYTKTYNLPDYPQDLDVLSLIKQDSITPSNNTTSKTINNDGSIEVEQNYQTKNATLTRRYKENKDSWELSLVIKDKGGNILYKTKRTFEKLADGRTITTINDKKYIAQANDEKERITIKHNNKEFLICGLIDDSIFFEDDELNGNSKELWEFCKTKLPADLMIIIRKLQNFLIPVKNELDSGFSSNIFSGGIYTANNLGILTHEIGHLLSQNNYNISKGYRRNVSSISDDEALKETYKKELIDFNETHSQFVCKNTIKYFSEFGGSKDKEEETQTTEARTKLSKEKLNESNGLEELIAETMYIKTAPNAYNPIVTIRTHYLMMNFPLTIAYIANKIDENCKNIF